MAIVSSENHIEYPNPDGIQVVYIYDFRVDDEETMIIYEDGVIYTGQRVISGLGNETGGTVAFIDTPPGPPTELLTFMRVIPMIQLSRYPDFGPFPAPAHELSLDKLTMITQQLSEELDRALVIPPGYPPGAILPPPAPGYTLVWNETGTGFDNAPGEESFLSWVDRSEAGADESEASATASANSAVNSAYWEGFSYLWAVEEENVLVNDGIHPPDYSAYHWAQKAEEGGIVDIFSEDEEMMVVNIPEARYRSLEMIHGVPGGMVKLDDQGYVPLDNLPFDGNMIVIGPIEGHDRCPKYSYDEPDETPCVEPDYRNPSERWPSKTWPSGSYFIIVHCDDEPLLNQMNLIDPDTGLPSVQTVTNNEGIMYLDGSEGLYNEGWYLYEGAGGGGVVVAEDVLFDDSMTNIKGVNVQLWNQAADAVIDDKVDQSGDLMTGNLGFMNNIGIQTYLSDATTIANLIKMNVNTLQIGDGSVIGNTNIYANGSLALAIDPSLSVFNMGIRVPNNFAYWGLNAAAVSSLLLIRSDTSDNVQIGGTGTSPETHIYASNTLALQLAPTLAAFSGGITIPNDQALKSELASGGAIDLIAINATDNIVVGYPTNPRLIAYGERTSIFAGPGVALTIDCTAAGVVNITPATSFSITAATLISITSGTGSNISLVAGANINLDPVGAVNLRPLTSCTITAGTTIPITAGTTIPIIAGTTLSITAGGELAQTISSLGSIFSTPTSHTKTEASGISGTYNLDWATRTHRSVNIDGATTFTFSTPPSATHCILRLYQPVGISSTWPTDIYWANGEAPITPDTLVGNYVVSIYYDGLWWGSWSDFKRV